MSNKKNIGIQSYMKSLIFVSAMFLSLSAITAHAESWAEAQGRWQMEQAQEQQRQWLEQMEQQRRFQEQIERQRQAEQMRQELRDQQEDLSRQLLELKHMQEEGE